MKTYAYVKEESMVRVSVLYCRDGKYGESVYKSSELTAQQMVDEMYAKVNPGIALRFLGENGVILPTGYDGDPRLYIPARAAVTA